jgi:threonine dehydratase
VGVYGVEPEGAAALRRSLDAGQMVRVVPNTIADGLAPAMTGEIPFEVARRYVDDIVLVTDAEIADAMGTLLTSAKLLTEPAGAAATAALLHGKIKLRRDARVVSVLSGANVGIDRLKQLL